MSRYSDHTASQCQILQVAVLHRAPTGKYMKLQEPPCNLQYVLLLFEDISPHFS